MLKAIRNAAEAGIDDCIILTNSSGKRQHVRWEGVHMTASRAVWMAAHGDPGEDDVLHTCNGGSGESGCINIRHLYLGDASDNAQDRGQSQRQVWGEKHHKHVLTEETAAEVLRRYKPRDLVNSGKALAAEFGVTPSAISSLVTGKTWPLLPRNGS
jgi:hypothetical protein